MTYTLAVQMHEEGAWYVRGAFASLEAARNCANAYVQSAGPEASATIRRGPGQIVYEAGSCKS